MDRIDQVEILRTECPPGMDRNPPARELQGVRAAVLGSTTGIGRAIAMALAHAGADVIVHGRASHAAAGEVAATITRLGVRSHVMMADLADREAGERLVEEAWGHWGGLDAWLQVAGADILTGAARSLSFEEKLDALLALDVVATIRLTRHVGRLMKSHGGGSIVTIGWDQAESGMEGDSGELFAAAKGAVMAFTRSLSLSLAPDVRVNAIAPGWIKTAWGESTSQPWHDRVLRETPVGRWGTPNDVAGVACFLVSPRASFVTGQIIRVNGGAVR
jgi:3-oxoacyl-[acyl-carrier protein] reductase